MLKHVSERTWIPTSKTPFRGQNLSAVTPEDQPDAGTYTEVLVDDNNSDYYNVTATAQLAQGDEYMNVGEAVQQPQEDQYMNVEQALQVCSNIFSIHNDAGTCISFV